MTIRQVSELLGVRVRTIRRWIKLGKIEAKRAGKRYMIPYDVVYSKEVQELADKSRKYSKRIKDSSELGVLREGQDTEESV